MKRLVKLLPVMLVACMLFSTIGVSAAVDKPADLAAVTDKVTVVVSNMAAGEEVAIMVYDTNAAYTSPADVPADQILYIDQKAAGANGVATFEFYLKDGASNESKTVAIGSANATAVAYETFEINTAPSANYGDVNGSGAIDSSDSLLLAQYLANWSVTVVVENADVDGSETIDSGDALRLAQYLANWSVVLGPKSSN